MKHLKEPYYSPEAEIVSIVTGGGFLDVSASTESYGRDNLDPEFE